MTKLDMQFAWTPELLTQAVDAWERVIAAATLTGRGSLMAEESYGRRPLHNVWNEGKRSHVTELVISDGVETEAHTALLLTLLSYSDGHGSDLDAANIRYIRETETPGVIVSERGPHDGVSAWMQVGEIPNDDEHNDDPTEGIARIVAVAEMMEGLHHYALLDDETHTAYVQELANEAWEAYLRSDLISELEELLPADADGDRQDIENVPMVATFATGKDDVYTVVRNHYYGFVEAAPFKHSLDGWRVDGATDAVVPRETHKAAVEHVLTEVFGQ